jgi:hypothetical protein
MAETIASLLLNKQAMLSIQRDSVAFMGTTSKDKTDAERLEQRLAGFDRGQRAAFARDHGIPGGVAAMYQHAKGIRPISVDAAIAYAKAFRCGIEDISPSVAAKALEVTALISANAPKVQVRQPDLPYVSWPFEHVSESAYRALTPDGQLWAQSKMDEGIKQAREKFGTIPSKMKA